MFIRAVRCYVFLLCIFILATLSHHLCFLLSFSSTSWCSLFIFLSVANLHHLTVSNFLFFPPLLYSLAVTVVFFFFFFLIHPYCLLPMLSSLPLVALCLRYFVWLTSVTARLCLVFCFVYVVSLGLLSFPLREWIHIHVRVLWKTLFIFYSLRPPRETNNLRIKCTH